MRLEYKLAKNDTRSFVYPGWPKERRKGTYIHTLSSTQFLILELAPPGIFNAIPTLMRS